MELKRVVLFTANTQGGIIQYTLQMYKTLREKNIEAILCLPDEVTQSDLSKIAVSQKVVYKKIRKVIDMRYYNSIAKSIMKRRPDAIWYMDDSVIGSLVGLHLPKKIVQLMTMHDAGGYHPSNHVSLREILLRFYKASINLFFFQRVKHFVLLSKESAKSFRARYALHEHKVILNPLGAHLPEAVMMKPAELEPILDNGYLMFFGRIDKYKGIGQLLKAYHDVSDRAQPLVIAGGGKFTDEEEALLAASDNLYVLNRYILDGEMLWLFEHCTAVVLPYIEATQSGVIPIAYHFNKPVIVSNVSGLTQFVVNGKTGIICENKSQWEDALESISVFAQQAVPEIQEYYQHEMDWAKNLEEMFRQL